MYKKPSARILLDSISPDLVRITTMEVVMHRFVLAEFNTHRVFSRNSASSRAIPYQRMRARVMEETALPIHWGAEQKGMQSGAGLSEIDIMECQSNWLTARIRAVEVADYLRSKGLHKSIINRLLEPFLWHTVIVTSTHWDNFFAQRYHKDAQPEIRAAATAMLEAFTESQPQTLLEGQWHTPLIFDEDLISIDRLAHSHVEEGLTTLSVENQSVELRKQISTARCARVSYLTHDGIRDLGADLGLYFKLVDSMHPSPFEHVATPCTHMAQIYRYQDDGDPEFELRCRQWGNLYGWHQFRKSLPEENRSFDYEAYAADSISA